MAAKKTKVIVAGSYNDPKSQKPIALGKTISVDADVAERGLIAGVFVTEENAVAVAPANQAELEKALDAAEQRAIKAEKGEQDLRDLLKEAGISDGDLKAAVAAKQPATKKAGK